MCSHLVFVTNSIHRIDDLGRDAVVERARLRPSPSTGSKNSYVIGVQKPDQLDALYNSMPSDLAPSPIAIYCPPFATMKADLKKPSNSFDFTPDQIRMAKKLIGVSSDLYSNEKKRQEALNGLNMFGQEDFWVSATLKVYKSVVRPDGGGLSALLGHPWFPFPINRDLGEVKTDQEGGCNPIQQGANVYKKVWSKPEVCTFYPHYSSRSLKLPVTRTTRCVEHLAAQHSFLECQEMLSTYGAPSSLNDSFWNQLR